MSGGAIIAAMVRRKPWTPKDLFRHGEKGAYYDFSLLSTLWQNTARTTPVTTNGQSISAFDDLSGNGLHQILIGGQTAYILDTTAGYNTGNTGVVNTSLGGYQSTIAAGMTGSKVTAIFGVLDASPAQEGWLCSLDTNNSNDEFMVGFDPNFANGVGLSIEGFNPTGAAARWEWIATGTPTVSESIFAYMDLAGTTYGTGMDLRVNGSASGLTTVGTYTTPTATAWDATKKLTIGCVSTAAIAGPYRPIYNGGFHRIIVVNRQLNAQEISSALTWVTT